MNDIDLQMLETHKQNMKNKNRLNLNDANTVLQVFFKFYFINKNDFI